ncbi:MAG: hypothetical protein Q7T37_01065 [bacterium]|nr:hypothetical protein [bacterium]MDO8742226.1 hypothetical protein [bacterium]
MDQDHQDLTFDESMKEVVQSLPPIIRSYLSQGKYTPVAKSLMGKYGLRIDQGGILEREIMLLLMGVESPDEFMHALTEEAKIGEDVADDIAGDVNAQIFAPLREEEMKESVAEKESVQSALVAAETETVEEKSRVIHHELPQVVKKVPVISASVPVVPIVNLPAITPIISEASKNDTVVKPAQEAVHEIPAPKPAQSLPRIIVPIPAMPRPLEPRSVFSTPQAAPVSSAPVAPPDPIKSYSVDPYREPIE